MTMIDHRYIVARIQAERLERLCMDAPAYARQPLSPRSTPKVQIGVARDPNAPIRLMPGIHAPRPSPKRDWRNSALWAASGVAVAMSFLFVGW